MGLDVRPEPHPQLPRRVEHQLAVAPHHGGVQHDGRRLHVCQLAAEEVVFEGCVGGLGKEGGGVVGWWRCGRGGGGGHVFVRLRFGGLS